MSDKSYSITIPDFFCAICPMAKSVAKDSSVDDKAEKFKNVQKNHKARTRMGAVRMVCVRNMPVKETADLLVRCPIWVRD